MPSGLVTCWNIEPPCRHHFQEGWCIQGLICLQAGNHQRKRRGSDRELVQRLSRLQDLGNLALLSSPTCPGQGGYSRWRYSGLGLSPSRRLSRNHSRHGRKPTALAISEAFAIAFFIRRLSTPAIVAADFPWLCFSYSSVISVSFPLPVTGDDVLKNVHRSGARR